MIILMRLAIIVLVIYLFYLGVKFIMDPKRKLEGAHEQRKFYFYDQQENVRKNFLITFKGVMFEGEKYLGTTEQSFEVMSIFIFPHHPDRLQGFDYDDFLFLENEVRLRYPKAIIDWKSPIKELVERNRNHTER